jgi:hypothetical protein
MRPRAILERFLGVASKTQRRMNHGDDHIKPDTGESPV